MRVLSLYETININGTEYMRILSQGIDTPERRGKFISRAKEAIDKALEKGDYLYSQDVFTHLAGCRKPYLDKYKLKP